MEQMGLHPHVCRQCGKHFECRQEYTYKVHKYGSVVQYHWFCSWKCLREFEINKAKRPTKREEQFLELLDSGESLAETARKLGVSPTRVMKVRDKWR